MNLIGQIVPPCPPSLSNSTGSKERNLSQFQKTVDSDRLSGDLSLLSDAVKFSSGESTLSQISRVVDVFGGIT